MSSQSQPQNYSQSQTSSVALPPDLQPSAFDTLPILNSLLTRVQSGLSNGSIAGIGAFGITASPAPSQGQSAGNTSGSSSVPAATIDRNPFSTAALQPKELTIAADDLRQRLRKAKAAVAGLPDMDRTIREQETEIAAVEKKIQEQRRCLDSLKVLGRERWPR